MALELLLWAPLLVVLVLIVIAGFRIVEARDQVSAVANAAAREASLATDQGSAQSNASAAAQRTLSDRGRSCSRMSVAVAAGGFRPGGAVRVTVTCQADLSDVAGFGIPGSRTFRHTAVVPIDTHRVIS